MPKFLYGSSLKWSVEQPCGYQGDNLAVGSVRQSHESLLEKLPVSEGYEVLYWVIYKDPLLNGHEIMHTWIVIVNNMKVALCRVECTPMDDNIWVSHLYQWWRVASKVGENKVRKIELERRIVVDGWSVDVENMWKSTCPSWRSMSTWIVLYYLWYLLSIDLSLSLLTSNT